MKSLVIAIKLVYFLLRYNKRPKNIKIIDDFYIGRDSATVPFKLFLPNKPRKHSIIIYPGASPTAEKHPGLIMLGSILARAGYTIYIPRIPSLKKLIIQKEVVDDFACFYSWILKNKNIKSRNLSLIGISFGGAITLKVFTKKELKNNLPKSIITYGTYYNFQAVLDFFSSGKILINNEEKKITPHPWGLVVMFYNYLSTIKTDLNVKKIKEILKLQISEEEDKIEKQIQEIPIREKQLTKKILDCKVDEELINYVELIREKNKELFSSLSPKYWNESINSKIFIFHGANDSMVPYTESIKLSKSFKNSELLISYLYEHKEIAEDKNIIVKIIELIKIIKFFYKFILYNEN
tara:strand:+ start:105 stop:1157 length:1053 start_codon:yes stop_codon:yes gene_type:complete